MTFQPITKMPRGGTGRTPNVDPRITLSCYDGKATNIILNKPLMKLLGWRHGERVTISVGAGADEGWIEVVPTSASGGFTLSKDSNGNAAKLSSHSLLTNPGRFGAIEAKFTLHGNRIYIAIPSALRAQEPKAAYVGHAGNNAWAAAE